MNILSIGRIVKERRTVLDIDQKTLSELSGVAVHTISDIESGRGNPTVAVLNRVLAVLGLELQIKVGSNES
jgi:transcriptional regulator with XRE-family HTH domain